MSAIVKKNKAMPIYLFLNMFNYYIENIKR